VELLAVREPGDAIAALDDQILIGCVAAAATDDPAAQARHVKRVRYRRPRATASLDGPDFSGRVPFPECLESIQGSLTEVCEWLNAANISMAMSAKPLSSRCRRIIWMISSGDSSTTSRMSSIAAALPGTMNGIVAVSGPRNPLQRPAILNVGP